MTVKRRDSLRHVSWFVGGVGLVVPVFVAIVTLAELTKAQEARGELACGMPALMIAIFSALWCAALSGLAAGLNGLSFLGLPAPRASGRVLELAVLALPGVVLGFVVSVILFE